MEDAIKNAEKLRDQIEGIEVYLEQLKKQLADVELLISTSGSGCHSDEAEVTNNGASHQAGIQQAIAKLKQSDAGLSGNGASYETGSEERKPAMNVSAKGENSENEPFLDAEEYKRYGRQMIMPEIGLNGQLQLKKKAVLIVGLGGLGCPAAAYLAGAGVGRIGLMDGDTVEVSNLHRQIIHSTATVGMTKVESAARYLHKLNPKVKYKISPNHLTPSVAVDMFSKYDIILDCTDNPASRYLVSDAAVLASKPFVSAAALKGHGQLMVLNNPPATWREAWHNKTKVTIKTNDSGHCYRCVFPQPPPADLIETCGEGGILGPVVGTIGILMATETLKLLLPSTPPLKQQPYLLLYHAFQHTPLFRLTRLGGPRPTCPSCSTHATITRDSLTSGSLDYTAFCGVRHPPTILPPTDRLSPKEYSNIRNSEPPHILIDVREKPHFELAHLKGSINVPFSALKADPERTLTDLIDWGVETEIEVPEVRKMYFICRFGNDSQQAVKMFREEAAGGKGGRYRIGGDVVGGLDAWRREVDGGFPDY